MPSESGLVKVNVGVVDAGTMPERIFCTMASVVASTSNDRKRERIDWVCAGVRPLSLLTPEEAGILLRIQ